VRFADATRRVSVQRVTTTRGADQAPLDDRVAVEAPLQVVLDDEPFAVIMRTPGDDEALVMGFLHAESVIASRADVIDIRAARSLEGGDSVVVRVGPQARRSPADERRRVDVNAACGMCGRVRVESLSLDRAPLVVDWTVDAALVASLPLRLRAQQPAFDETGGLHAAGLFDREGALVCAAEDVGRHNAVDKVVGRLLLDAALPASGTLLVVSGRLAYEIVQKAFLAGIPLIAAVSAPSSLAVELAEQAGITLAGFVRGEEFNVYAHCERVVVGNGGGGGNGLQRGGTE
jgi:FdhD protein